GGCGCGPSSLPRSGVRGACPSAWRGRSIVRRRLHCRRICPAGWKHERARLRNSRCAGGPVDEGCAPPAWSFTPGSGPGDRGRLAGALVLGEDVDATLVTLGLGPGLVEERVDDREIGR